MRFFFLGSASILLLLSGTIGLDRLSHKSTSHFSIDNISSPLLYRSEWEAPPLSKELLEKVRKVLHQPFTLCGEGTQFYVFCSADKSVVLKFFKHHKLRPSSWFFSQEQGEKEREREKTFASCKLAYEKLRKETALLFLHLNKTEFLHETIPLIDKKGKTYRVDLDQFEFLLQRRADPPYSYIAAQMTLGKLDTAKEAISELLQLIDNFGKKGVVGNDPVLHRNFGFVSGRAIQTDIGRLEIDPVHIPSQDHLRSTVGAFKQWIEIHYPALSPHLEAELARLESR